MILLLLMASIVIAPIADAVLRHSEKTPIGSVLRTTEWAKVPLALRNRAQFSAGIESARVLQRVQDGIGDILGQRRNANGALSDRSGFIRDLTQLAIKEGLEPQDPADRGGLKDITSERRAELIYSQQTGDAYGHANWKGGQDPDALDAFPAQELVRIREAETPRDWISRWTAAGGRNFSGRMIALKGDPIWTAISHFGNPWPPFDFNSGMWVEDVSRSEAEELGLLTVGEQVKPDETEFNERLESSVKDLSPALRQNLQSLFGDQVDIDSETIRWKGNAHEFEPFTDDIRKTARSVFSGSARALGADQLGDGGDAGSGANAGADPEIAQRNAVEISAVASGRKPLFHEQLGEDLATPQRAEAIQRTLPQGIIARAENGHLYVYHPDLAARFLDPTKPLFPQIQQLTEEGRNGLLLGYGVPSMSDGPTTVLIRRADGLLVGGFRTKSSLAELYGAARAKDFADVTGGVYYYEIVGGAS